MHRFTTVTEADIPRIFSIMRAAFAGEESGQRQWLATMGLDNIRAMCTDSGTIDAVMSCARMGHYFGGRIVPTAGIVGVAVAPERRGSGIARTMMAESLREARATGLPLSTLYASTQSLYRQAGYEMAGSRFQTIIAPHEIGVRARTPEIRPISDDDHDAVVDCHRRFASHFDGPLERGPYIWARIRQWRETKYAGYAVISPNDPARIDGYLYMHQQPKPMTHRQNIMLSDIAFTTPEAGRRLLGFLADYAMVGDEVSFSAPPAHPILALMPMQAYRVERRDYWMLRITDLPRALELRGHSTGSSAVLNLRVRDEIIPENAGEWTVSLNDGRATVTRGHHRSAPTISCDIRALGPMYSGFFTPAQARLVGWIDANDNAVAVGGAAARLFPAGTPWMNDMF